VADTQHSSANPETHERALVVDSFETDMRAVSWLLRASGYVVIHAGSCSAARNLPVRFDAAIVDLELEDGCGAELAGELLAAGKVARVVFYTDSQSKALVREARGIGPVIAKDDGPEVLLAALRTAQRPMSEFPGAIQSESPAAASGSARAR
jgi:DNA-binding NarL/FixJ family response regulator